MEANKAPPASTIRSHMVSTRPDFCMFNLNRESIANSSSVGRVMRRLFPTKSQFDTEVTQEVLVLPLSFFYIRGIRIIVTKRNLLYFSVKI